MAKSAERPAGIGRRRPLLNIEIERLHLDPENPRLPEEAQKQKEDKLLLHLYRHFDLEEIAAPMAQNGYFDEEPLVGIPNNPPSELLPQMGEEPSDKYLHFLKQAEFTVVEGNRRLATARILLNEQLREQNKIRGWPEISPTVRDDLQVLPIIVYPTRREVLPYLGVRHITGTKKWESYQKARYIVLMLGQGHSLETIEQEVGDRSQAVRKSAIAYLLLEQAKTDLDWDITRAKDDFSYMLLAIGQKNIKNFLGWSRSLKEISVSESPVPNTHLQNFRDFLSWVYGDAKIRPVIQESRDITNYLSHVLSSPKAIEYLRTSRDLKEAYDLTDGEESMVRKLLGHANIKLEKVLGIVHRHKTPEVRAEAERCVDTASRVLKTLVE